MFSSSLAFTGFCLVSLLSLSRSDNACLSPFQLCPSSGECALSPNACGRCGGGQYLCPFQQNCVNSADDYVNCPGLSGTHFDWTLPIDERLAYLTKTASLQDKIGQLWNDAPEIFDLGIPAYNWLNDDEHGVRDAHATTFPDGCGLGATWSKSIMNQVGNVVGTEARALYNAHVSKGDRGSGENGATITLYAPNLNLVRDPRWGRAQEVYSEDPRLTGELTYQFVTGLQFGGEQKDKYLLTGACCKHWAAYDIENRPQERYYFNAEVDARNWAETYAPAFYDCVVRAKGSHVMCSYNSVNGVPACGSTELNTDVLRNQWNFTGFVVSDYDAMAQIKETHHYADSYAQAAAIAIKSGCDQEGGGTKAIDAIPDAISQGLMTEDDVNQAFERLFRIRIQLGLLDPPTSVQYNYLLNDSSTVESEAHLTFARQVAAKSVGLYKNENDVLPLDADTLKKLVVVGPQAAASDLLLGNYAEYPDKGVVTILEGLRDALEEPKNASCTFKENYDYYQPGQDGIHAYDAPDCCSLCYEDDTCNYWTWFEGTCYKKASNSGGTNSNGRTSGQCLTKPNNGNSRVVYAPGCSTVPCDDNSQFSSALNLVDTTFGKSELSAVMVLFGLEQSIEHEGGDRSSIELPGYQNQLISDLYNATSEYKVPLICLMIHGGTLALGDAAYQCDAILDGWYPGSEGGLGIADVIFGGENPAGRVTVTYYHTTDDLPTEGAMDLYSGLGVTYRYFNGEPLYPFGFGLSYTAFKYSNLKLNTSSTIEACDAIQITVTVTNSGAKGGDEVVQLYVKQTTASKPVPNIRLADFERVSIASGDSIDVQLILTPRYRTVVYEESSVQWYEPDLEIETGTVQIYVGGGQPDYTDGVLNTEVTVSSADAFKHCPNQN